MLRKNKGAKPKGYKYVFASKACGHCGEPIIGHPRCKDCKILLHKRNRAYMDGGGKQSTEIGSFGRCLGCTLHDQE